MWELRNSQTIRQRVGLTDPGSQEIVPRLSYFQIVTQTLAFDTLSPLS